MLNNRLARVLLAARTALLTKAQALIRGGLQRRRVRVELQAHLMYVFEVRRLAHSHVKGVRQICYVFFFFEYLKEVRVIGIVSVVTTIFYTHSQRIEPKLLLALFQEKERSC